MDKHYLTPLFAPESIIVFCGSPDDPAGQTAQAQAGLNAAQRAQNDTYSQGMYGNEIGINQTQLAAHGTRQNLKSGQQIASQQVQANAQARADAQRNQIIGMVGTGISMGMASLVTR